MIVYLLIRLVQIVAAVSLGWWAARSLGAVPAVAIGVLVSAALPVIGAFLLRTSELERITWKNRLAGLVMPWGWRIAGGRLLHAAVACGIIWLALYGAGVAATTIADRLDEVPRIAEAGLASGGAAPSRLVLGLLVASWVVDGGVLVYLFGTIAGGFRYQLLPSMPVIKVGGFVILILAGSIALALAGRPVLALCVAGIPPLAVGLVMGVFLAIILIFGRNLRWN